jgi:pimeloyl-ACP methyl ester carboxylesterase
MGKGRTRPSLQNIIRNHSVKYITGLKKAALAALFALGAIGSLALPLSKASADPAKSTIILVHGAWEGSSSWDGVVSRLQADGYTVIAAATPLRSLSGDASYVSALVNSVKGPVVLVGHSYGGSVITNAATTASNVRALVYVSGYAPDAGENVFELTGKFPGTLVVGALGNPVAVADGAHDLYIQPGKFRGVFAADLPAAKASLLAATQRPITDVAAKEPSGAPAWKSIPSWFVYGSADMAIPPSAHAYMAQRAQSNDTVIVKGASHLVMVSNPAIVAKLIEKAAAATAQ